MPIPYMYGPVVRLQRLHDHRYAIAKPRCNLCTNSHAQEQYLAARLGHHVRGGDYMPGYSLLWSHDRNNNSMLFFFRYIPLSPWFPWSAQDSQSAFNYFFNLFGCIVLLIGYYCIAASHFNYTIDVMFGAMMSYLVFETYHYVIRVAWLYSPGAVYPLARWFERYAKDLKFWRARARQDFESFTSWNKRE